MPGWRSCDQEVTGVAPVSFFCGGGGGQRRPDEIGHGETSGVHWETHRGARKPMEVSAGEGEAGTTTNRRRRPAESGGFGGEIDELRGAPACAARLRRTSRARGSRRAARRGAGETVAPAASSARKARVSGARRGAETERGRG